MTTGAVPLHPEINLSTITDGRGGIFTFYPEDHIVELNMLLVKSGHARGEHYHKEFTEYFMVISGLGVYTTRDVEGQRLTKVVSGGEMFKILPGTPHVIHAMQDMLCVAALTKKWNDCEEPITHCAEGEI